MCSIRTLIQITRKQKNAELEVALVNVTWQLLYELTASLIRTADENLIQNVSKF
jgi:hypothetical protein